MAQYGIFLVILWTFLCTNIHITNGLADTADSDLRDILMKARKSNSSRVQWLADHVMKENPDIVTSGAAGGTGGGEDGADSRPPVVDTRGDWQARTEDSSDHSEALVNDPSSTANNTQEIVKGDATQQEITSKNAEGRERDNIEQGINRNSEKNENLGSHVPDNIQQKTHVSNEESQRGNAEEGVNRKTDASEAGTNQQDTLSNAEDDEQGKILQVPLTQSTALVTKSPTTQSTATVYTEATVSRDLVTRKQELDKALKDDKGEDIKEENHQKKSKEHRKKDKTQVHEGVIGINNKKDENEDKAKTRDLDKPTDPEAESDHSEVDVSKGKQNDLQNKVDESKAMTLEETPKLSDNGESATQNDESEIQGKAEADYGKPDIDNPKSEDDNGKSEIDNGKPETDNGKSEDDIGKTESDNGKPETDNGKSEDDNGKPEIDSAKHETEKGKSEDDNGKPETDNGKSEDDNGKPETDNGKSEDDNGKPETENGKSEDDNGKPETDNGKSEDDNGKPEIDNAKHETEKGKSEDDNGKPETDNGKSEDDNGKPETDNGKSEDDNGNPETDNGKSEDDNGKPETDNGKSEDGNGKPETDNGKSEGDNGKIESDKSKSEIDNGKTEVDKDKSGTQVDSAKKDKKQYETGDLPSPSGKGGLNVEASDGDEPKDETGEDRHPDQMQTDHPNKQMENKDAALQDTAETQGEIRNQDEDRSSSRETGFKDTKLNDNDPTRTNSTGQNDREGIGGTEDGGPENLQTEGKGNMIEDEKVETRPESGEQDGSQKDNVQEKGITEEETVEGRDEETSGANVLSKEKPVIKATDEQEQRLQESDNKPKGDVVHDTGAHEESSDTGEQGPTGDKTGQTWAAGREEARTEDQESETHIAKTTDTEPGTEDVDEGDKDGHEKDFDSTQAKKPFVADKAENKLHRDEHLETIKEEKPGKTKTTAKDDASKADVRILEEKKVKNKSDSQGTPMIDDGKTKGTDKDLEEEKQEKENDVSDEVETENDVTSSNKANSVDIYENHRTSTLKNEIPKTETIPQSTSIITSGSSQVVSLTSSVLTAKPSVKLTSTKRVGKPLGFVRSTAKRTVTSPTAIPPPAGETGGHEVIDDDGGGIYASSGNRAVLPEKGETTTASSSSCMTLHSLYTGNEMLAATVGGVIIGAVFVFFCFFLKYKCNKYYNGDYQRLPREYDFEMNPRTKTHEF